MLLTVEGAATRLEGPLLFLRRTLDVGLYDAREAQIRFLPSKETLVVAVDQAASVEPGGFERLVKYIRVAEQSLGDGIKRVYDSELPSQKKLRRVSGG